MYYFFLNNKICLIFNCQSKLCGFELLTFQIFLFNNIINKVINFIYLKIINNFLKVNKKVLIIYNITSIIKINTKAFF